MKRFLIAAVLLAVCFNCLPVSAQDTNFQRSIRPGKNPVRYASIEAFSDGQGVWLRWQTEVESKNLGFYVYRIVGGERELVSPALIPGADMQAREEKITSGSYSYFDRFGDFGSTYVIESVNVSGRRNHSDIIQPQQVESLKEVAGSSSEELAEQARSVKTSVEGSDSVIPEDLATNVEAQRLPPDATTQRWVAAQPGVKIRVKNEGFYRVARADLQANGFDVNAPTDRWQLYVNGVEQAIIVGSGGSYIEFYGKGVDTLESETQVYYLLVGTQSGKRIGTTTRRRMSGATTSPSYAQTFFKKERLYYTQNVLNGETENIFGSAYNDAFPATISLNLTGIDTSVTTASIDLTVQGVTLVSHLTRVFLNNVELGTITGSGDSSMVKHFDFPTSILVEGNNSLRLTSQTGSDQSSFNSVKVNFARRYRAEQNRLSFYIPNYQTVYADNFTTANVRVFDLTVPDSPTLISGLPVELVGGNYRVTLPSNRGGVLYALENSATLSPASLAQNLPSTLSTGGNSGDLIIISHKDFLTQAEEWATYRRGQGLAVKVVDIEDVLDEFNYGVSDSLAIRSFLNYAKISWQNAPEYALLIGDGTFDPKNYFGLNGNFMPSKLVDTIYTETSSDETLADFNDDGLAEIAIGRIPARTAAVVSLALAKTKSFEQLTETLNRKVLFASDLDDGAFSFAAMSERLCKQMSPDKSLCVEVNRAASDANAQLVSQMNQGKYIINYSGHGNASGWAANSFFGNTHAEQLSNTNRLSVFTLLTCLNGYFIGNSDSLTEVLMKNQNGGAAASWASTGLTTPDVQEIMATRFYSQIAAGTTPRIGDLIKDAKTTVNFGRDVRLSWALIGDPTLKVR